VDELVNHKRRCPDRVSAGQGICLVVVAGFEPTASSFWVSRELLLRVEKLVLSCGYCGTGRLDQPSLAGVVGISGENRRGAMGCGAG
jgi:hypothetical protein